MLKQEILHANGRRTWDRMKMYNNLLRKYNNLTYDSGNDSKFWGSGEQKTVQPILSFLQDEDFALFWKFDFSSFLDRIFDFEDIRTLSLWVSWVLNLVWIVGNSVACRAVNLFVNTSWESSSDCAYYQRTEDSFVIFIRFSYVTRKDSSCFHLISGAGSFRHLISLI